ncbi:HlyD family secretion protein [Rhizobium sp. P32RR-XVIII]|uniref:HlyD family secretion protein n=1 Tax=Rhizobium sp. P32RR-XVIII TaxID=2726738 RepID=UPI00145717C2|nr:HlyD family secretion protein [Rhizobium sp. P32RR-XVIII]NLS06339.1 HlyD family secretion protein [Rhizobium sp. P32RR-XVIII]
MGPDDEVAAADKPARPGNQLRNIALGILLVAVVLFVLSIFMERRTPISSQAQVQAYVVGIAPEVAGRVIDVGVTDNSRVEADQVLFHLDPNTYNIAVERAEATLSMIGQSIGASTATVDAVQAKLVEAESRRDNLRDQATRALALANRGVFAKSRYDEAKSAFDQSEALVKASEAELAKAKEQLGPAGKDNPQIKEALAALERAQVDLLRTTVRAPSAGVVTNLQLAVGNVLNPGQTAMTFIDVGTIWIAAAFKENSLGNIAAGNSADIIFDVLPGELFTAKVESVGFGVSQGATDPSSGLPIIRSDSGWLRDPQRFRVRLLLDEPQRPQGARYGSQATVVVYTGNNLITNAVGALWIRILSVLSYVR